MGKLGPASEQMLTGVHPTLVEICHAAVEILDFKVLDGVRTADEQAINLARGVSWTKNSKHLLQPDGWSHAVDLAPWTVSGVHWQDVEMFCVLAGVMRAVAFQRGIRLRWGGDWNSNDQTSDERNRDYGHFELPDGPPPVSVV